MYTKWGEGAAARMAEERLLLYFNGNGRNKLLPRMPEPRVRLGAEVVPKQGRAARRRAVDCASVRRVLGLGGSELLAGCGSSARSRSSCAESLEAALCV